MNKYQIVTNNNSFRIQKMIITGFFKKREIWEFIGKYYYPSTVFHPFDYPTYTEAKTKMDDIIENEEIKSRPWKVVNENPATTTH